jgi:ABC-type branched-subunit amino acid transport system substrate-binding protein
VTRPALTRRQLLVAGGAIAGAPFALAQPGKTAAPLTIAQIYDTSASQQDVSKDFLIGSRAFWQDVNAHGGVRGRHVQHVNIEVDGSPASVRAALASIKDNPSCVALSGTAGDPAASQVALQLRNENIALAHVAPWLQNSSLQADDRTFPIFAGRQEQIAFALKSLTVMGVQAVGAIYATAQDWTLFREDIERIAASLKLSLASFQAEGDLSRLGQKLTPQTPAILLFVGGTPELVQFTQGLESQQRQRYIVALADVNLQTLMQMGGAKTTPVIVTQTVPLTTAALPVVRQYREVLGRLFDEPPVPLSLAGFIAARYTYEILKDIDNPTRANVLAAFQRRSAMDVGGYAVAYDARRRAGTYVTQSMLTQDGRVIG